MVFCCESTAELTVMRSSFSFLLLVNHKLVLADPPPPPVIFIAGRPKAALLFWFFGDFRYGALLFIVIYVRYKYKNR